MNELRAKPMDLCMASSMPFQQHFEFGTTHPLADVIHDKFFLTVRDMLRSGDQIVLCRFDGAQYNDPERQLLEIATVRVVKGGRGHDTVPLALIGEIVDLAPAPAALPLKSKRAA